jgi:hypothetical protein
VGAARIVTGVMLFVLAIESVGVVNVEVNSIKSTVTGR